METSNNPCNDCPTSIRGFCCRHKIVKRLDKTHFLLTYGKPCEHLNKAGRCKIYKKRREIMGKKCLTIEEALQRPFVLPHGCGYYRKQ